MEMWETINAFGAPFREHSSSTAPDEAKLAAAGGRPAANLAVLLREYDPDLERRVFRAFKQWNNVVRDQLRNEMGFRLSIGDESQSVPVRVMAGYPAAFQPVLEQVSPDVWRFLLRLPAFENAVTGLNSLIRTYDVVNASTLPAGIAPSLSPSITEAAKFCGELVANLRRVEVLKRLGSIHEDILGAYFFRVPEVHLYWMVIGLFAGILGISVEALTVVVATHELAHAYSHLGRDIDGQRWETEEFARADIRIVEGMAQFYTEVVCRKLEVRYPALLPAYQALLSIQTGPYTVHQEWTRRKPGESTTLPQAGEIVRATLVQCRNRGLTAYTALIGVIADRTEKLSS